jgi:hypothetical protein
MDEFHSIYFTGLEHHRAKMQFDLKLKRLEDKEQFAKEREGALELAAATNPYRMEVKHDGRYYFPGFDIVLPQWCPVAVFKAALFILRCFLLLVARIKKISDNKQFDEVVTMAVLANTALMCCQHSRSSPFGQGWGPGIKGDHLHVLFHAQIELGFICLFCFFTTECCLKILGYGFMAYIKNPMNAFDFILVSVGLLQFQLNVDLWECMSVEPTVENCDQGGSGLIALRVLRLIRVLRSFSRFTVMKAQIDIVLSVMKSSYSLFVLLIGFAFMFAGLGTQLFYASTAVDETNRHSIGAGTNVWVKLEGLGFPAQLPGRPAKILNTTDSFRPWVAALLSTFSDLQSGTDLGTVHLCLEGDGCKDVLKFVLPQENFSSFTSSVITVLQVMLRSGWTEILRICIFGSGYFLPCLYFYTILFLWPYFLGNICGAVLIVGFTKKFEAEKDILRAAAFKQARIRSIHREFKETLMAAYLRPDSLNSAVDNDEKGQLQVQKKRLKRAILKANPTAQRASSVSLQSSPFEIETDAQDGNVIALLKQIDPARSTSAVPQLVPISHPKGESSIKSNKTGTSKILSVSEELEIVRLQESIVKMTDFEREIYFREGLTSLEIGQHIAVTLGVAATLLDQKVAALQQECDGCPGNLKFYYEQQICQLKKRALDTRVRIRAVQHGDQKWLAWFFLPPYHPIRNFSCIVVHSLWFQRTMTAMAIASCVTLWIERPAMDPNERILIDTANSIINLSFISECILKVSTCIPESFYFSEGNVRPMHFFIAESMLHDRPLVLAFLSTFELVITS